MAYEKLNLEDGTVLNAEHLAHIEAGIENSGGIGQVSPYATAEGLYSHAEGYSSSADGYCSHAEGWATGASGEGSHAEGWAAIAHGQGSHAEGQYTIAKGDSERPQHVQGRYNIKDTECKYAHIVGNGTANNDRSNAHTLDWDGVPWFAGDRVMLGGTGMDDENAMVLLPIFAEQDLTDAQKAQARANIGVSESGNTDSAVLYTRQTLTEDQRAQARENIGASAVGETGPQGEPGKSAYAYALDGGFAGTEAEFAEKLCTQYLPAAGGAMLGPIDMNGQTLSGLNTPAADDQAANKGYVDSFANSRRVRDILDNSDFTNPVNQRGATTYNTNMGYAIDRWIYRGSSNSSLTVEDGCITLTKADSSYCALKQCINLGERNVRGKTVTAAIKIKSCTGEMLLRLTESMSAATDTNELARKAFTEPGIILLTYVIPETSTYDFAGVSIAIISDIGSYSIEWAALYEGEYTAETLPEYQPKGYGAELAECQRYYQSYDRYEASGYVTTSSTDYVMMVYLPVPMRIAPSITLSKWVARINSGGYSKHSTNVGATPASLRSYGGTAADTSSFCVCDRISASAGDTNNSLMAYTINDLTLSADL